jgi:hypothetical protein
LNLIRVFVFVSSDFIYMDQQLHPRLPPNRTLVRQRPRSYNASRRNWANIYLSTSLTLLKLLNMDFDEDDIQFFLLCGITTLVLYLDQVLTRRLREKDLVTTLRNKQ